MKPMKDSEAVSLPIRDGGLGFVRTSSLVLQLLPQRPRSCVEATRQSPTLRARQIVLIEVRAACVAAKRVRIYSFPRG